MRVGNKKIFHLEAWVVKVMSMYKVAKFTMSITDTTSECTDDPPICRTSSMASTWTASTTNLTSLDTHTRPVADHEEGAPRVGCICTHHHVLELDIPGYTYAVLYQSPRHRSKNKVQGAALRANKSVCLSHESLVVYQPPAHPHL